MKIVDRSSVPRKETPHHVDVRMLYNTPDAQAIHIELQPGEALKKHITPVDVFFYILDGEGVVEIGEETETVSRDMLIESPAGIVHRLCNPDANDAPFRFLVVKTPRPTKRTQLL